jgi:hypothetical protein
VLIKQIKPRYFVLLIPFYTVTFMAISYGLNALGHSLNWSNLVDVNYSFWSNAVTALIFGCLMTCSNWFFRKTR